MERIQNVTLEEAYQHVQRNRFGLWSIKGNYMNIETLVSGENVQTLVFLGESIFLLELSVEREGFNVMASRIDFIDIWACAKTKYPRLFEYEVKGDLCLFP